MANCQNSNERLFGGAVVLEVADGCPDVKPLEAEWMALAAGTSKGFDFNPNELGSVSSFAFNIGNGASN